MKKLRLITGLISVIMPLLVMLPQAAHATGEVYYFSDSANQTIVAQNGADARGILTDKVQLSFQAPDATNVYFGGQVTVSCANNVTNAVDLSVKIAKADYQKTYPTPATLSINAPPGCDAPKLDSDISIAKDLESSGAPSSQKDAAQCDQGALSWATCPLIDKLSVTIANLATNFIRPLLELNTISQDTTPKLYVAWENVRNLADVGFVFVFLFIIFAHITSTRIDQYTIRRMIPRLVTAAILVQFSFVVCSFVVDLGNVLGAGIQGLILTSFDTATISHGTDEFFKNIALTAGVLAAGGVAVWAAFPILIPILLMMLISILAFFFIMSIRFLVIAILIVISPLAFLAWTLPNTEEHFRTWWKAFFRLVMMYPIIMAILAIAGRVNELLAFTGSAGSSGGDIVASPGSQDNVVGQGSAAFESLVIGIIRPFLIVAAFALITRTYHWAGTIVAGTHGRYMQIKGGRSGKNFRNSDFYKDRAMRQRDRQRTWLKGVDDKLKGDNPITKLSGSKSRIGRATGSGLRSGMVGAAALMAGGAAATDVARERQFNADFGTNKKELETLGGSVATVPNLLTALQASYATGDEATIAKAKLMRNAPGLNEYTRTEAGRMAVISRLAEFDALGDDSLRMIRKNRPGEYQQARVASGKLFSSKPNLYMRWEKSALEEKGGIDQIKDPLGNVIFQQPAKDGDMNVGQFTTWLRGKSIGDWRDRVHGDVFAVGAKRDKEGRDTNIAFSYGTSDKNWSQLFDTSKPNAMMDAGKRLNMIRGIIHNPDLYDPSNPNGNSIARAIQGKLDIQEPNMLDLLVREVGWDDARIASSSPAEKTSEITDYMYGLKKLP